MLQQLYDHADHHGITVIHRSLNEDTGGGACTWVDGQPVVYLDPRLPRAERAEVLAHELAHVHRGHRPRPSSPAYWPVVAREEAACDRHAARMLVDLSWLADTMALAEADHVTLTAEDVAAEAEVTVAVAERAMQLLTEREVRVA